jgi:hypothetical protein
MVSIACRIGSSKEDQSSTNRQSPEIGLASSLKIELVKQLAYRGISWIAVSEIMSETYFSFSTSSMR